MNTEPVNIERATAGAAGLYDFIRLMRQINPDQRAYIGQAAADLADVMEVLDYYRRPWYRRLLLRVTAWPWVQWLGRTARRLLWPAVVVLALAGCRAPGRAVATLRGAGYVDPVVTGSAVWGCAEYPISDAFTARTAAGDTVRGCVCRRYWGTSVIRVK